MKIIFFVAILFISFSLGCNKPAKQVDVIDIRYTDNVDYGDVILAKDSQTLRLVVDTAKVFKRYKEMKDIPEVYIIKQEALQYLSDFISDNCDTSIYREKMIANVFFSTGVFSKEGLNWCYTYYEDDGVLHYFEKMLEYINKSKYKYDFREVVPNIETYISNCKKIKKYGKDDWYNH